MRTWLTIVMVFIILSCNAQKETSNIKSVLLQQLKYTHTEQDWFVPINIAIQDVSVEQSNWRDSTDNHSIGQLVSHLIFWNERVLTAFVGNTPPEFKEDNKVTFNKYNEMEWPLAIKKLDSIQTAWEHLVEHASEK